MASGMWVHLDDGLMVLEPREIQITRKRLRDLSIVEPSVQAQKTPDHDIVLYQRSANVVPSEISATNNVEEGYLTDVSETFISAPHHSDDHSFLSSSTRQLTPSSSSEVIERRHLITPDRSIEEESVIYSTETQTDSAVLSDSESGTDFLESPCNRRKIRPSFNANGLSRRCLTPQVSTSVRRRLNFYSHSTRQKPGVFMKKLIRDSLKSHKSQAMEKFHDSTPKDYHSVSLTEISGVEREPVHNWTTEELIILCLLYRFYDGPNASETIPRVFNAATRLQLRPQKIRNHFNNHLCLFGRAAVLEFKVVFNAPFRCKTSFIEFHNLIESKILALEVDLRRRDREITFKEGWARTAKSPRTRRTYKSRVKRVLQQERVNTFFRKEIVEKQHIIPEQIVPDHVVAEVPLRVNKHGRPAFIPYSTVNRSSERKRTSPVLAFRVWHGDSACKYIPSEGFLSQDFLYWNGPVLEPPSPGHGGHMLMLQMKKHLDSKAGGPSPWISVSTTLLHALAIAAKRSIPRIAVIDLEHPTLSVPNKMHHAEKIINWLRPNQCYPFRYHGTTEMLIWSNICEDAIIHQFSLRDLINLADEDPSCKKLMNLELFTKHRKARAVAKQLENQNTMLDLNAVKAMASIAKLFRLHTARVTALQGFIADLVNSFHLRADEEYDDDDLAHIFAKELRSQLHSKEDVMSAFNNGIKEGFRTIASYANKTKRRS